VNTRRMREIRGLLALLCGWLLGSPLPAVAQTATPQSFPMIETGMHTATINRITVDAVARYAVTVSDDKTARVWDLATGRPLTVLRVPQDKGSEGKLYAVALSPDGGLIALGGFTGPVGATTSIYLLDRASGHMLGRISGLPNVVSHLAFSLDGRHLAAALGGKNRIRIFSARPPWDELPRGPDDQGETYSVDFDRTGRLVATGLDGKLRLYSPSFRRVGLPRSVPGGREPVSARFSPDGRRIAVGFRDRTAVSVVAGDDLKFLYAVDTRGVGGGDLSSVAWSADGQTLYAAGGNRLASGEHVIRAWTQQGRGPMQAWPVATSTVMDLRALPEGRLVFAAADPAWGVLDAGGKLVVKHSPPILDLRPAENFDSFRLSTAGDVVELSLDTWREGRWQQQLARFDLGARTLQRNVKPQAGLSAPRTEGLAVRDWEGSPTPTLGGRALELESRERARSLAISADAQRFALGAAWSVSLFQADGRRLWRTPVPAAAWRVNLTPDGRFVVAALGDGTLRWYRTGDGSEALALFVHADGERWVLWTPEGFFDAAPGAENLLGYHLNQGREAVGEFVTSGQLRRQFFRPDLVARRLLGDEAAVPAAVGALGDVRQVLSAGLAPQLELLSPAEVTTDGEYELRVRIRERTGGVGHVEIKVNGAEGRSSAPTGGMLAQRLPLGPGRNVVRAVSYTRDGKLASEAVEAIVTVRPSGEKATLHVLAVGVTGYRDPRLAAGVRFAAEDAKAIAASFAARGLGPVAEVSPPVVLVDGQATRARIEEALMQMASRVKPIDLFVLYLAGHGITHDDGEYYYLPWEVRYVNAEALRAEGLGAPRLRQLLSEVKSSKTVVLIDTCSSGSFQLVPAGRDLGEKGAIDRFARLSGRVIIAAAGDKRMALESPDNKRGIFTGALIRGLEGAADSNRNGLVEVGELAIYVEDEVPRVTLRLFNYEQFPMHDTKGQNFPISRVPSR
jgi:WD40 repeat protein